MDINNSIKKQINLRKFEVNILCTISLEPLNHKAHLIIHIFLEVPFSRKLRRFLLLTRACVCVAGNLKWAIH